jgi:single-strand DNA-binding protein
LRQDRWEKDGQKFSKVVITANNVQLLGGKSDSGQQTGGDTPRFQPKVQNHVASSMPDTASFAGDTGGFPEDIPF